MTLLLQISYCALEWKNFENWTIFGEVMDKSAVTFLTQGVLADSRKITSVSFQDAVHVHELI